MGRVRAGGRILAAIREGMSHEPRRCDRTADPEPPPVSIRRYLFDYEEL